MRAEEGGHQPIPSSPTKTRPLNRGKPTAILAKQIIEALEAAGLHVIDGTGTLMQMGRFAVGIQVAGPNKALAAHIRQLLSQTQLAVASESPPQLVPDPVGIVDGVTRATPIDASILLGVKPPTR